jgi:threonylcarbamoyladenosine tRNA methylthiotransferase MtaB
LRIQSGCDETCAFCIVPALRGPSRSVPIEECCQALKDLVAQGAQEIVLTGTNIALWGRDLSLKLSLLDLLKALTPHLGSARLRLSSLEVPLVSPEFLEWCVRQPRLCRHFHFAVQSADAHVLEKMERAGPSPELDAYLRDLVRRHPEICLGADVIAGFPGETEAEFEQTTQWVQSVPLSYLHVFSYSPRYATKAARLSGAIPEPTKARRCATLTEINSQLKKKFISRNLGTMQEVVGVGSDSRRRTRALTSNYLRLTLAPEVPMEGKPLALSLQEADLLEIALQSAARR